jgi:hypothetical protein
VANSFFPALQKVLQNPLVRWLNRGLLVAATVVITKVIWPIGTEWIATRASVDAVEKITKGNKDGILKVTTRVDALEQSHTINYDNLNAAGNDTGHLNEGEQVQWAVAHVKQLQQRMIMETRARVGFEVLMQMPNPKSARARRAATLVRIKFDELIQKGEEPEIAAQKSLDYIWGG